MQELSYAYDSVGNITKITDLLNGEIQNFGYDALDRLTSANAVDGLANYSETYSYYSASGNLWIKGGMTLEYNDPAHAHAVTDAGGNSYQYDQNGNQVTRIINGQAFTLGYDAENRLVTMMGEGLNASFVYDGDGRRVKSVINGETTLFVGSHYEVTDGVVTKYYFAGSQRIAMKKDSALNFIIGDHLGSTSIVTDANGSVVSEMRYKAWGEVRHSSGSEMTKYQYTSQYSNVSDFGLMYYGARWMDPQLGRFTQPDTIIPSNQGVQAWDRYGYVSNNPIRYTDPTGHACVPCLVLIGIGVIYTTYVIYTTPQMQELGQQAAAGLENAVQMPKYKDPKEKTIKKIYANNNTNADSSNGWWPEKGIPCLSNAGELGKCGALIAGVAYTIYSAIRCGEVPCPPSNISENQSAGTSTPTPTDTPINGCPPPYLACSQNSNSSPDTTLPPPVTSTPSPGSPALPPNDVPLPYYPPHSNAPIPY